MITTTLTNIETLLIAALPALTAIASIIGVALKIIKDFASLKESVKDNAELKAERDELKEANRQLLAEAKKQCKTTQLLIEKFTKIAYKDLSEVKDDEELQN